MLKKQGINMRLMTDDEKKTKKKIVTDWLPRYTGMPLKDFGEYILLVNFKHYIKSFSDYIGITVNEFWEQVDKNVNYNLFKRNSIGDYTPKFKVGKGL